MDVVSAICVIWGQVFEPLITYLEDENPATYPTGPRWINSDNICEASTTVLGKELGLSVAISGATINTSNN